MAILLCTKIAITSHFMCRLFLTLLSYATRQLLPMIECEVSLSCVINLWEKNIFIICHFLRRLVVVGYKEL
jgi:hypothetical protein